MHALIVMVLIGQNSVIRNGLGLILKSHDFDVRQSVDHHAQIVGDCAGHDLLLVVDSAIDHGEVGDIETLHRRFPMLKLVVLSEKFDFDSMVRAFAAGVYGYLAKEIQVEPLIRSLRLIATGEKVMPSRLVDELALRAGGEPREQARHAMELAHLSAREVQILSYLVLGHPNKTISRRLSISDATVKVHVKAILRKLHVKNRTQAAILAMNGAIDDLATDGAGEPRYETGIAPDDISHAA